MILPPFVITLASAFAEVFSLCQIHVIAKFRGNFLRHEL